MNIDLTKTAIIVVDVAPPGMSSKYNDDYKTNQFFLKYLNHKLKDLKNKGSKIIEINYYKTPHASLSVKYDFSSIDKVRLLKYLVENNIKTVVYVGFHYGRCTHSSRKLSPCHMKKYFDRYNINYFVCPFLSRPHNDDYGKYYFHIIDDIPEIFL